MTFKTFGEVAKTYGDYQQHYLRRVGAEAWIRKINGEWVALIKGPIAEDEVPGWYYGGKWHPTPPGKKECAYCPLCAAITIWDIMAALAIGCVLVIISLVCYTC